MHQAQQIERAGRNYILAFRKLNVMSQRMGKLAWVMVPKIHVSRSIKLGFVGSMFVIIDSSNPILDDLDNIRTTKGYKSLL